MTASPSLDGTWQLTGAELSGRVFDRSELEGMSLTITGDAYEAMTSDRGRLRIFPDENPMAIDMIGTEGPHQGRTILARFDCRDDELQLCYHLEGSERPQELKTFPGSDLFLLRYERLK